MQGIYKITCLSNNKVYIGSSVNIERRWKEHKRYLRGGYHKNPFLQKAWDKYGESNFLFEVVEEVTDYSLLYDVEQSYIDKYNAHNKQVGFNLVPTAGSNLGMKHTEEAKRKMSAFHTGKKRPGIKMPPRSKEAIRKTAEWHRGRKRSPETCANISKALTGKKASLETRIKMSKTRQGNKNGLKDGNTLVPKEIKNKKLSEIRYKKSPLTEDDVREIKRRLANGEPGTVIAEDYGVVKSTINSIKLGKTWTHVQ